MKAFEFHGTWWLPNCPDRTVAGTLKLADDGMQLVLYGSWENTAAGVVGSTRGKWVLHEHSIVHGIRHDDSRRVSLLNTTGTVLSLPFDTMSAKAFDVQVALVGEHVAGANFQKISFELDFLTAWAQPPSRRVHDPTDPDTLRLQTQAFELARTTLSDGSIVLLRSGLEGSESDATVQLREFCAFDIELPKPVRWGLAVDYVRQGRDLLTISLGQPVRVDWVCVFPEVGGPSLEAHYLSDEPLVKNEPLAKDLLNSVLDYQSATLLTAHSAAGLPLPIPLATLLRRWFSKYSQGADALDLLLSRFSTEKMLPEHRYASLFGCIEELHKVLRIESLAEPRSDLRERRKRVAAAVSDAELRVVDSDREWVLRLIRNSRNDKSIAQKVRDLLDLTGDVGAKLISVSPKFSRNAAKARGKISHGASGSIRQKSVRTVYELALDYAIRVVVISHLINLRDRSKFQSSASERSAFLRIMQFLELVEAEASELEIADDADPDGGGSAEAKP